jgi:L-iditol 2-dehydrogenase
LSRPHRQGQGAFTPYMVVDDEWVHRLPAALSFDHGALVEPLAVAVHAVRRGQVRLGQSGAIFGAGPIGLLLLQLARLAGMAPTFITDLRDFRLEAAWKLGASHPINAARQDAVGAVRELTGKAGVDRAFEAVGAEATLAACLKVLKPGGTAVIAGIFEEDTVPLPVNLLTGQEIHLVGARGYCWDFQEALALLDRGAIGLEPLITHRLPLADLPRALEMLADPAAEAIKVVIQVAEV